ncbi:TetR/AcrR family transcriptional regulator [Bacillus sp. FSL W8-0102]|uniref:TetR/AcrR family transcriptional regulator n=1 Tax=Bacillus sp. FSL W8-0102 TaxID=2978205 RepID=UPI0030F8F760
MSVDRKKQILDAAAKSFSLFGYKATTMDQVAKLANVGKGTIYNFFKNKEDLFHEIVSSLIAEMKEAAEQSFDEEDSFVEKVHRALYQVLDFRRKHQLTIKLFQEAREMGTPAVLEVMDKIERSILDYIRDKIEMGIKHGEIKNCNPEVTAFVILKTYISLIFDWERDHEPLGKDEIARLFDLYFFQGLSK